MGEKRNKIFLRYVGSINFVIFNQEGVTGVMCVSWRIGKLNK